MLRIGRIAYANCTPIFHALLEGGHSDDWQFVSGVPAHLNALLSTGEIDICPSSSIEYALHPDRYLILPQLSISSIGPVGSVLLFSRIPINELSGRTVMLSSESATSVNLLRILLEKKIGCSCHYQVSSLPLADALSDASAMLLIGDAALRSRLASSQYHVYDLGSLWYEWTGLPFVFALWLCRRQAAAEKLEETERLAQQLVAAKHTAVQSYESIAALLPEMSWMGCDRLVAYWRDNISYDLDNRHLDGLILFYRYCAELGLLPAEPELHFLTRSQGKVN